MTAKQACSVDGCDARAKVRGLCWSHYLRLRRHGDPMAGATERGKPLRFLMEKVRAYDGDDCLIWPFGRSGGYGTILYNGKKQYVHRVVCFLEHGPPPTSAHEAAHSCGRGHAGCVNRRHLSWKTSADNKSDMIGHGTAPRGERNGQSKLTRADVLRIRALKGTVSQAEIAKRFGVHQSHISRIQSGDRGYWRG